jgi:orotidine-5'-phosphate decarboxylase
MELPFSDRLAEAVRKRATPVVVGLDPRWEQLPSPIREGHGGDFEGRAHAYREFCRAIIDVVAPLVPAVKPQSAFFEELGPHGMAALGDVIRYASAKHLLVILDAKRNDIGSTATAYAKGILGRGELSAWGADALTVSPYLGDDSLQPFVDTAAERQAGIFVLVKTSNPGGTVLQDLIAEDRPIYQHVGQLVERLAHETVGDCGYGAVGAVVGATYPEQLGELRRTMPHTWFLVPGFGAQGGAAADVAAAFDQNGLGAVINSSRGIIFAYDRQPYRERFDEANWQRPVEEATRDMILQLRAETPAGKLAGH